MNIGLAIVMIPVYVAIFGWLVKYNDHLLLKLSNVGMCLLVIISMFVASITDEQTSIDNPIITIPFSIFGIGCFISIFTAFGNALEKGSIIASIIMIMIGIFLCCTGVGLPFGLACFFKAGGKGIGKSIDNYIDEKRRK